MEVIVIIDYQAWKGMLDGDCFMKAGWVHCLKLHAFTVATGNQRFVIMGKVIIVTVIVVHYLINMILLNKKLYRLVLYVLNL